jgi:hypothetical protein
MCECASERSDGNTATLLKEDLHISMDLPDIKKSDDTPNYITIYIINILFISNFVFHIKIYYSQELK